MCFEFKTKKFFQSIVGKDRGKIHENHSRYSIVKSKNSQSWSRGSRLRRIESIYRMRAIGPRPNYSIFHLFCLWSIREGGLLKKVVNLFNLPAGKLAAIKENQLFVLLEK